MTTMAVIEIINNFAFESVGMRTKNRHATMAVATVAHACVAPPRRHRGCLRYARTARRAIEVASKNGCFEQLWELLFPYYPLDLPSKSYPDPILQKNESPLEAEQTRSSSDFISLGSWTIILFFFFLFSFFFFLFFFFLFFFFFYYSYFCFVNV